MATLLTTYGILPVVLILIIGIPAILNCVKWILDLIKKHKANQQEAFNQGRVAAQEEDALEERLEAGEEKMADLDERESTLEQILRNQQEQIAALTASDNLNIKQEIKRVWVKTIQFKQSIDYHDLEILNEQFRIYKARGGNSWAEQMMHDINTRATIVSPYANNNNNKQDQGDN